MFFVSPRAAVLFLLLAACGCAGPRSHDLIPQPAAAQVAAPGSPHRIFVATTRDRARKQAEIFDGRRSPETSFAHVTVAVPANRATGSLPVARAGQPDPAKHFTPTEVALYRDGNAISAALRSDLRRTGGRALVFVHGYNTHFDSAVYRLAQIAHDGGYSGTPVLFSWASGGRTFDYIYDKDSATVARDALEETLRLVARSGATRIDLVAHSMGTWVATEALRQLAIAGDRDLGGKLGEVVLASPDIDVDIFKSQMKRIGVPDRPYFILLSGDDRALRLSSVIAGNKPRVGDYAEATDLSSLGVTVVNLSGIAAGDRMNHAKFADNPLIVRILGQYLSGDETFAGSDGEISMSINSLAEGVLSAGELIVTTPFRVLRVAVGG